MGDARTDRLTDADAAFIDAPRFATVATIEPDGTPQLSIVWVGRDGGDVLFSTLRGRRKTRNLERDPRASILVHDRENPYTYLDVRGPVVIEDDPEGAFIDAMSWKYHGRAFTGARPGDRRVIVRLTPTSVLRYG